MADSFFGFDTSSSNLNQLDDEGGAFEPSEDEYDALNDETFGGGGDELDWEEQHEEYSAIAEKSRQNSKNNDFDLEASLSHLELGEATPSSSKHNAHLERERQLFSPIAASLFSPSHTNNVWGQPEPELLNGRSYTQPVSTALHLKNVCTVEELERSIMKQQSQQRQVLPPPGHAPPGQQPLGQQPPGLQHFQQMPPLHQQHNFFQARFPPGVQQRPPAPALPMTTPAQMQGAYAHQQHMYNHRPPPPHLNNQHMQMQGPANNPMGQMRGPPPPHAMRAPHPNPHQAPQMKQFNPMAGHNNKLQQMVQLHNQNNFSHPQQNAPPPLGQQPFRPHLNANNPTFPIQMPPPQLMPNSPQVNHSFPPGKPHPPMKAANHKAGKDAPPNQGPTFPVKSQSAQSLVQHIQSTHPMLNQPPFFPLLAGGYHNASHHPLISRGGFFNGPQHLHNQLMFAQNNLRLNGMVMRNGLHEGAMRSEREDASALPSPPNRAGGDGADCSDEYAGMMTQREKQWLINIQLLQLNTGTPYLDDYYYTVFLERKSKQETKESSEAHKANQQNHPFYTGGKQEKEKEKTSLSGGGRERHNSARTSEDGAPRTYVPLQFENSLGKLQCGSVTAPRKIIDVEVVGGEDVPTPSAPRRHRQLLLDIEALYCLLLRLEEMGEPLAIANALVLKEREEKAKVLLEQATESDLYSACAVGSNGVGPTYAPSDALLRNIDSCNKVKIQPVGDSTQKKQAVSVLPVVNQSSNLVHKNLLDEDKEELMTRIFLGLLNEDKLTHILNIRKGKSLVCRVLNRAPPPHAVGGPLPKWRQFWCKVFRSLPHVARRDAKDEDMLPLLVPPFKRHLLATSGWELIGELCRTLEEGFRESVSQPSGGGQMSGRGSVTRSNTPTVSRCPLHMAIYSRVTLSCVCVIVDRADSLIRSCADVERCTWWCAFLTGLVATLRTYQGANTARPTEPLSETFVRSHVALMKVHLDQSRKNPEPNSEMVCDVLIKYLC